MEPKKNPNVDVGRNSSLYFAIGLNILLLTTWLLLEHKTYISNDVKLDNLIIVDEIDEDIPVTNINHIPPPPPPSTPVLHEVINVVEDEIEIEETLIESTETDMDQVISEQKIVRVEDVVVKEVEEDIEVPFAVVEQVPIFPGCSGNNTELITCFKEKITQHIRKHFEYPKMAIESNKQGKVYVMFVVDKKGNIDNVRSRGPYKILENEAQRIISLLPKMKPAKQRNNPVKVSYSIPITFKFIEQ